MPPVAPQPSNALFTAMMMSATLTEPLVPDGHAEIGWLPRSMFTMTMISSIVTTPSPLQSPRQTTKVGVGVGVAVAVAVAVTVAVALSVWVAVPVPVGVAV